MSLQKHGTSGPFERIVNALDDNSRAVKIGVYSVALIGLAAAVRRVRPFTHFKKPSDVPNHFIIERRELLGRIDCIDPTSACLMVKHQPLVRLPFREDVHLPVKISGINITGHGISWLQAIVVNCDIKFIPVVKEKNCLQCEVFVEQANSKLINVGESLVAIGFGSLQEGQKQLINPKYYKKLKVAEKSAIRKQMGYRYYLKLTTDILWKMSKGLYSYINNRAVKARKSKSPKLAIS